MKAIKMLGIMIMMMPGAVVADSLPGAVQGT